MKKLLVTIMAISILLFLSAVAQAGPAERGKGQTGKGKGSQAPAAVGENPDEAGNDAGKGKGKGQASDESKAGNDAGKGKGKGQASDEGKAGDDAGKGKGKGQGNESAGKEKNKDKDGDERKDKVTGQERVLLEIQKQITNEENKHRSRVARIERARELMKQGGDEEGAREAGQLLEKENQRHARKLENLRQRQREAWEKYEESSREQESGQGEEN